MKRLIKKRFIAMCLVLLMLLGCAACSGMQANENQASQEASAGVPESIYPPITGISTDDTLGSQHLQITQELISMLDHCVFRRHPDTDFGNIRTAYRNYPDSVSETSGHLAWLTT